MHNPRHPQVMPVRDGVSPSCVALPTHGQGNMLDFLSQRLPVVGREEWCQRMLAGEVVDERGQVVAPERPFEGSLRLYYYRSLSAEPALPFSETVVYRDEHLVVADKPHFMPVTPSGHYLHNTLLVRLKRQLGLPELSPLHRIDRDTAGLVMLSVQQRTRGVYQALFRDREITKHYDAIAPWRADVRFPREHTSRMEESPQFFRMQEAPGEPNSHTHMQVVEVAGGWARYRLSPITGKRHQLRVHMAALGLPLRNDPFYPVVNDPPEGDYSRPLQLLARSLEFMDPLTGEHRVFESRQSLNLP
ncbi:23S rRNA-/tRNA-specific pseudouridylate synthase [Acidovorax sp. 69]|uniref:pseudouridine synthase n=1 Tax=Acidovorax sp. 69 TaxID=2035202 RepID=UPI000C238944|nr:pseudouridine synthase [Acidovorax sp. 69]PJI97772.1 23S rRNA-/tRNA-specific pseudouridylate synthase [Acidovorax sp. 69]